MPFALQKEKMNSIDMKEKYHQLKVRYNDLANLRIESMKINVNDLRLKIEEHKKIHEISVRELRIQNEQIKELAKEMEIAKDDLRNLAKSNLEIIQSLKSQDPTLNVLLDFPELVISCKGYGFFEVSCGPNEEFIFSLKRNDEEYIYKPIKIPTNCINRPSFIDETISFDINDLKNFCNQIHIFNDKLKS